MDLTTTELIAKSQQLESRLSELQVSLMDCQEELRVVRAEIAKRQRVSPEPRISDHVLIRYLARICGVDIEAIKAQIMTENVVSAIRAGATAVTQNGVKFVVRDFCLVTVLEKETPRKGKNGKQPHDSMKEQLLEAGY